MSALELIESELRGEAGVPESVDGRFGECHLVGRYQCTRKGDGGVDREGVAGAEVGGILDGLFELWSGLCGAGRLFVPPQLHECVDVQLW